MGIEAHESITATELVRNLSGCIDKVRITRRSLYITKGTQTVAELSPPPKSGLPIEKLGELLAMLPRLGDDAAAMEADIKAIREQASLPGNPWD
jgi:hypothetical protein